MKTNPRMIGALIAFYFTLVLLLLMGPYLLGAAGETSPAPAPTGVHTMPTPDPADYL